MTDICYNQASSFSSVFIAGVLAVQSMPTIAQPDIAEQSNQCISGATYRASTNTATYSPLSSLFTGEYVYAPVKFRDSWVTSELKDFLLYSSHVSLEALDDLQVAIRNAYGDVQIEAALHTDTEEGWTKPVIKVHSGIEDFDVLMDVEDRFFDKAEHNPNLRKILPLVIISQA